MINREKLYNERFVPCLNKIYSEATCAIDIGDVKVTVDWMEQNTPLCRRHYESRFVHQVPYEFFFIDKDRMKAIVKEYTKGLRGSWYYNHKFMNTNNPNWKEDDEKHSKILHDFRDFEYETSKDKSLTPAERREKIKIRAIKDGFEWRIWDAERISAEIYMGPSPSNSKERLEMYTKAYNMCLGFIEVHKDEFKSWTKEFEKLKQSGQCIHRWEQDQLKQEESDSFESICEAVTKECGNMLKQELNREWGIEAIITDCVAMYFSINK